MRYKNDKELMSTSHQEFLYGMHVTDTQSIQFKPDILADFY